ncbi:hypothetical protein BH10BAC1_BH10BAC1_06240 [soil metagenome]
MKYIFYSSIFILFAFAPPSPGRKANKTIYDTLFAEGDIIQIPTIPFYTCTNYGEINIDTKDSLNIVADFLLKYPELTVEIASHADLRGSVEYTNRLSKERARACANYLIKERNIDKNRIIPKGYGEFQPIIIEKEILKAKTAREREALYEQNKRIVLIVIKVNKL